MPVKRYNPTSAGKRFLTVLCEERGVRFVRERVCNEFVVDG